MKRWITLFVSFAVFCSALSLGIFADEPELDIQDLYVYANIVSSTTPDFATEIPQSGQITDRGITNNLNQRYSKIKSFSFTCPAGSWFLIDFDVVGEDNSNSGSTAYPVVRASRKIYQYSNSDFTVSGSVTPPTLYRAEVMEYTQSGGVGDFVHFSLFGLNSAAFENNITISFKSPVTLTANLISPTANCYTQRIKNVNCKISFAMEQMYDVLTSIYERIDDTYLLLNDFYTEFHSYWVTFVNTYTRLIYQAIYASTFNSFDGIQQNQDGTFSLIAGSHRPMIAINNNLYTIAQLLGHQLDWENKAVEAGANDTYDSLNDSASFGDLTDFAGAGSAASWSSGSFVNGLDQTWSWFTVENKNMIDAVQPNRDEVYISIYDDTLAEYNRILGGE